MLTQTLMPSRPAKMMKLPDSSKTTLGVGACRSASVASWTAGCHGHISRILLLNQL